MSFVVWGEAASWLAKFGDAVLTVLDVDGYPVSVRIDTHAYDSASGELRAVFARALDVAEGPANLLCHYHDEKMWHIQAITVKGRLHNRNGEWVFASTSFTAPSRWAMLSFVTGTRTAAQKYLDKRGLARPQVNWAQIKKIGNRVRER